MTTALPDIIQEMGVTANAGQWLTSGFSLAMGIMIPATAWLIQRFPTKPLFITSMFLFSAGALVAAIAPTFVWLLIGRITQALGTGILLSLTQVVILTIYPQAQQGGMMGIYGLAASAAPIIAPTITGLLIDYMSWRIIFWFGLGVALVDIIFALVVMKDVLPTRREHFDWPSFLLVSAAFTGITIGFGNLGTAPFLSSGIALPLGVALLMAVVFVWRSLRIEKPLLDLRAFRNRVFRTAVILSVLMYAILIAASTLFPIYVQTVHHLSATVSGLIMMPGSLLMAVMSPITGRLYDRFGIRPLVLTGGTLLLVSSIGTSFLTIGTSVAYLTAVWTIRSAALACMMMPIVTWSVTQLSGGAIASASAILTTLRTIAGAVGAAVMVALMAFVTKQGHVGQPAVASVGGMNAAFMALTVLASVLLVISLWSVRRNKAVEGE
ncbi:DHA2 family efflux MFS transporter permease subunit [Schleiferilactobacillus shenzhenensis]|uniref:DHA2 family efflux MFS transporter permease subunit n=1 Tax=Schleiferilactobacillus shenzhenensis TaxID=1231337 RepID=UPI001FDEE5DA|nr:DHA2 family efflux MFS transporter permease subunit [Schleiferilactobacillus shenzhenensis]